MKNLIALLGALALTTVVACDSGKGSEEGKAGDKTAMAAKAGDGDKAAADKAAADKAAAEKAAAAGKAAAKPVDEAEVYAATILDSDFDAEALREINEGNAQAELDTLAKAIEAK